MSSHLVGFQDHGVDRFYASGAGFENRRAIASDGGFYAYQFEEPFRCVLRQSQATEIAWAELGLVCLISENTRKLFESEGITGFAVEHADARLLFPHEEHESKYWVLSVTGWGGIARAESGITQIPDPANQGRLVYSPISDPKVLVDWAQWDCSDFFIIWPMPGYWWISERLQKLLEKEKLKRFRLVSTDQPTETKRWGRTGFTPGRLRHYFPDDRARLIGSPLGIY